MTTFIQGSITGILQGLMYAAVAAGLALTLGIMGIINVAHSALAILAAYLAWTAVAVFGVDPLLALVVVSVAFFFVGMVIEKGLLKQLYREEEWSSLLVLFGLMIVIETLINIFWTTTERAIQTPWPAGMAILGYRVWTSRLIGGGLMLIAIVAVHLFLTRGRVGRGMRAMAANRDAAEILGIDTNRLSMLLFGLGTALAAAGGIALGLIFPLTPQLHLEWLVLAILVVVIGGLGGIKQTVLAGIAVGLVESLTGLYMSFRYVSVVLYLLLIVLLWVRREGLAGQQARTL